MRWRFGVRSDAGGFAALTHWTDGRHTVECYGRDPFRVLHQIGRLGRYYRHGPGPRVTESRLISLTREVWSAHRRTGPCADPACPVLLSVRP